MKVDAIEVTCTVCGKKDNMQLNWSKFDLPDGWRFRTRSFNLDDSPSDIQIACSEQCRNKL